MAKVLPYTSKRIGQVTYNGEKYTRKSLIYVRYFVDRQHVGVSDYRLIRMLVPMVKKYPHKLRHMAYQYALECHAENGDLYSFVMSGGHGYTGRK